MTRPLNRNQIEAMNADISDQLLRRIADGWQPPCTTADLERASKDAMKAIARDMPDPVEYAAQVPLAMAEVIVAAVRTRTNALRVPDGPLVPLLRAAGLICIGDRELTCFGTDVRRELMKDFK